jgi:hypothetical protein
MIRNDAVAAVFVLADLEPAFPYFADRSRRMEGGMEPLEKLDYMEPPTPYFVRHPVLQAIWDCFAIVFGAAFLVGLVAVSAGFIFFVAGG